MLVLVRIRAAASQCPHQHNPRCSACAGQHVPQSVIHAAASIVWEAAGPKPLHYSAAQLAATAAQGVLHTRVCHECLSELRHQRVPAASFVRFDTGKLPVAVDPALQLPPLTLVEMCLVAVLRSVRHIITVRPAGKGSRANDLLFRAMKGHVIAFPSSGPQLLALMLPGRLQDVPKNMQVIFITRAASREQVAEWAQRSKPLWIKGRKVVLWARHLAAVYQARGIKVQLDEQALAELEQFEGVPQGLIDDAVCAETDEQALALQRSFYERHAAGMQETQLELHQEAEAEVGCNRWRMFLSCSRSNIRSGCMLDVM